MKMQNVVSSLLVLGLATTVTAGSMYITVRASVMQDAVDLPEAAAVTLPEVHAALAPEDVPHDRHSNVVLDANGGFNGRLTAAGAPAVGYTVQVIQHGAPVGVTQTDSNGQFSFDGLSPGAAGILASSGNGIMLYGARLVGMENGPGVELALDVDSAVITGPDVNVVRQMFLASAQYRGNRFSGEVGPNEGEFPFGSGEPSTSILNQPVTLDQDGGLSGVVSVMDERTGRNRQVLDITVHALQGGKVVATAVAGSTGDFTIHGLTPGIYSIVGTGRDGAFGISVEAVSGDVFPAANPLSDEATPVTMNRAPGSFSVTAAGPMGQPGLGAGEDELAEILPPPMMPFGGGMGGGGGGFGGGGGGLGLGGLLGLAGLGAGLAALADDDDDNQPASPGI